MDANEAKNANQIKQEISTQVMIFHKQFDQRFFRSLQPNCNPAVKVTISVCVQGVLSLGITENMHAHSYYQERQSRQAGDAST